MKKLVLIPFASLLVLGATSAFAQDRNSDEEKSSCHEKSSCNEYFYCYRAWKKDMKRQKKLCLAAEMSDYRPFAAERKRRKACKKAWKRDILEHQHEMYGYGHDYWW
jgi:hypothetical protein